MKVGKVIKYVIAVAVAAVLLYFSFRDVDWTAFNAGFVACRWRFIILAMLASVAAFFFRSQRWRCLLKPFDAQMDPLTTFNGVNIGYLANFVFPRIGEVVRCGFVADRSRRKHRDNPENAVAFDNAIGTVLLSRTWDILVIFVLLAVLLVGMWDEFGAFFSEKMWEPLRSSLNVSTGTLALTLLLILAAAVALAVIFRNRSRLMRRAADFVKGIAEGFVSCFRMPDKKWFFIYTVLLWAMYWLMSMSVIWAVPQLDGLGWIDAWFVCLVGSVAWIVPVPGGFGAYHGLVALALTSIYGLSWDDGILFATLNHESQAITMLVCGGVSYVVELFRK